jgi:hypothetical protein
MVGISSVHEVDIATADAGVPLGTLAAARQQQRQAADGATRGGGAETPAATETDIFNLLGENRLITRVEPDGVLYYIVHLNNVLLLNPDELQRAFPERYAAAFAKKPRALPVLQASETTARFRTLRPALVFLCAKLLFYRECVKIAMDRLAYGKQFCDTQEKFVRPGVLSREEYDHIEEAIRTEVASSVTKEDMRVAKPAHFNRFLWTGLPYVKATVEPPRVIFPRGKPIR